jgi:hypothetical protein
MSMKLAVFWVIMPSSPVEVCLCFKVLVASIIRAMVAEAARTSAILVNFYQTTQHYNPEITAFTADAVRTSNPTTDVNCKVQTA